MKKSYLTLAAMAMIMASCSNEVLVDNEADGQTDVAIGFSTFSDAATKSTGSAGELEKFHKSFKVYGSKKNSKLENNDQIQFVFPGVDVDYQSTPDALLKDWKYSPARYWDKQADNYKFVAFAPKNAPMKYTFSEGKEIDQEGKFTSTDALVLEGTNLQNAAATYDEINLGFTGDNADCDVMITKSLKIVDSFNTPMQEVDLIFGHTLAKLLVTFNKSNADCTVKVKDVTVSNYLSTGSFDTDKWTAQGTDKIDYLYSGAETTLEQTEKYFIESLIMPQNLTADQIISIHYSITTGNYTEKYYYEKKLSELFTTSISYEGNNVYKLKVTIAPEAIIFDAGAEKWTEIVKNPNL